MMQLDHDVNVPTSAIKAAASAWGMRFLSKGFVVYALVQGITIVLGGPIRFSSPGYAVAREFPYSPSSVGLILLLSGLLVALGLWRHLSLALEAGLVLGAAWAFFFGLSFLMASRMFPGANTTAVWSYWFICFLILVPAVISHSSHPKRRHKIT